jgi:hypothetical protein
VLFGRDATSLSNGGVIATAGRLVERLAADSSQGKRRKRRYPMGPQMLTFVVLIVSSLIIFQCLRRIRHHREVIRQLQQELYNPRSRLESPGSNEK